MNKGQHHIIQFACIIIVLTMITLQSFTKAVKMKPLRGFVDEEQLVDLSFSTYFDGTYQDYLTEHAKRNTGFREFFIRNYNQVAYSCFNKITNNTIVKGLHKELYLKTYIDEITGKFLEQNFSDVDEAKATVKKNVEDTKRLVDTLHQHGKVFLFVFAPTKTAVYTETMPKNYQKQISDFSLEEYYIELFKENGIPHIDFYNYFKAIKDTISYPLYTRYASHWAESTIPFVADSILRKIEALGNYKLPSIECIDMNVSQDYSNFDKELELNLNLLFPCPKPALPNPILILNDTLGKDSLHLLVIGDSYFDQLMSSPFIDAFCQWDFWKYYKIAFSRDYQQMPMAKLDNTHSTLKNADIIMVIETAPIIYSYMYGFLNSAYDMLHKSDLDWEVQIQRTINIIKNDPQWYDAIVKQAKERGLTVEENLRINAIYILEQNKK